jgi:hypothetical protein
MITHGHFRPDRLELFWWFVCERQTIWHRREVERLPPPWTQDPILQTERFTNVYRELDPGTQYAIREILERQASKKDKIFNIMLYRLIGRAETHAALGFQCVSSFDARHMEATLNQLRRAGKPPFTAAYMVSAYTSMGSGDKIENVVRLFTNLHREFELLYGRIEHSRSAAEVHEVLNSVYGFGNFLAYQVLVDLLYPLHAYGHQGLLPYSHDDWASAGPGAQRGISMLLREGVRVPFLDVMRWLRDNQVTEFSRCGLCFPYLHDQDGRPIAISLANIQNCLCEYHKYVKIRSGTGRGRRKFTPLADPERQVQLSFGLDT